MTTPTKPVAEIVAEIMKENWPNHTGGWVCNYADVEACLTPIIAELTSLSEENEKAVTLLLDAKPLFEQDSPRWKQWVLDVRAWLAKRGTNP